MTDRRTWQDGWRRLVVAGLIAAGWGLGGGGDARGDDPAQPPPIAALGADPAKRAVAPIAPDLPGAVVAALQGGKPAEAIAALDPLIADAKTSTADRGFYRLVRGIAARLAERPDDARATWQAALDADPKGPWANKLRGELAALELANGHPDRAEALARAEAEGLLAPDRKDRLAGVYRDFARRLLEPDFPGARPDPAAAHALLAKARDLAKGPELRASLLFAMGRAAQAATKRPAPGEGGPQARPAPNSNLDPARDYEAYLAEYPKGADRDRARFHLGEVQLATRQAVAARATWTDLARDLGKPPAAGAVAGNDRASLLGRALYGIARTHGVPNPPDATSLNLGVAALRRFLRETPADPKAPQAAFEIGVSYLNRGQADPAIAAFAAFLKGEGYRVEGDDARRARAELATRAAFLIARATLGQGKYPEAIAAFESYLNQHPNGPESGDARRAILDAQWQAAQDKYDREQFAEARAAWLKFAEVNPLDGRVPQALFLAAQAFAREKKYPDAIAAWDALAARFPNTPEAAHGQFEAAALVETEQGDPAAAIERFRKVRGDATWTAQANQRIAAMEARALTVVTPRTFRSGETAQLKVATRNLENLTFSAYKLNPEAYFRKKHALGAVGSLDIGLVAPDAEWTVPVPGYGKYKPIEANFDLKVAVPGVYVVKVSDEKHLQASALVVGSDLDAIVKASRDQLLVFAQDMKAGRGRAGARVIVASGDAIVFEGTTGADGVVQGTWKEPQPGAAPAVGLMSVAPQAPGAGLSYLVLDGKDAAGSGLQVPDQVAQGLSPRAYIDTDRPAYRPGQEVLIRGVVREVADGQYRNPDGAKYKLEVADSQGRTLLSKETTLSPFGTFRDAVRVAAGAPVGAYRIRLWQPGGSEFAGEFQVQAYQLEKLDLEFDLPQTVFYRGATVKGTLKARYGFDAPAAGRPIAVRLPDGRVLRGQTDAAGQFPFEFATDTFGEDQALPLVAQLTADNVATRAAVRVAVLGFGIGLSTPRPVYLDGETFTLTATTTDALGKPTGQDLRVAVIKPVRRANTIIEREVESKTFKTDPATGVGRVDLKVAEAGNAGAILRVAGTDQFGNAVVADHAVTISGRDDAEKLRILADRTNFKVGEAAAVRVVNRAGAGTALVAWEADRILRYQLLPLKEGENALEWPVEGPQFPNFTLTASRMDAQRLDQARLDVKVERDLRITLKPKAGRVGPGGEVEVEVTAVDQVGRPAQAEIALALVDRALLRQFGDKLPPIGPFFYDQTRLGSFRTEATITFSDHPATEPVPDAVVDEAQRQLALAGEAVDRKNVLSAANGPIGLFAPATPDAAPTPAPSAAEGSFGFGGQAQAGQRRGGQLGRGQGLADQDRPPAAPEVGANIERDMERDDAPVAMAKSSAARKDDWAKAKEEGFLNEMQGVDSSMNPGFRARLAAPAPPPRQATIETAYWNPSVVTGTDGKAVVKFRAPAALSEYRLMAKGITGADSLAGQESTTIAVRQDFYVDLRVPPRLTEGDKPRFVARVHHVGLPAKTRVEVRLASYAGEQDAVDPKTVEIGGDGVTEVLFDPIAIPDAESIRLTATARAGDRVDEVTAEVPIHPWGVQAVASASGTASNDATAFVALPAGRRYDDVALQVQLAPTLDRLVLDLAQGSVIRPLDDHGPWNHYRIISPPIETTADRAAGLLAAVAGLDYLKEVRATEPAEAERLRDRARGLVGALTATQNGDGGWPWVTPDAGAKAIGSHRHSSSRVAWALRAAQGAGIEVDAKVFDSAANYLAGEFNRAGADQTGKAAVLHALAVLGRATFEQANSLNRGRQGLNDFALAYLALTFGLLDRPTLAGEVLDVLAARASTEAAGPGEPARNYWEGRDGGPWLKGRVDATALASLAFARVRPNSPQFEAGVAWLLAHRDWSGWSSRKAQGTAVAAVAASKGKAGRAADRYRLVVNVNDVEVATLDVQGAAPGRTIAVPRKALKVGAPNVLRFHVEGRGTYGYAATLTGFARDFGPEQRRDGKPVVVADRAYLATAPELDGKALPTGFEGVVNATPFVNKVTQVARGGRARVRVDIGQDARPGLPQWDREFLIVEETLPAGATLVEGSLQTNASAHTLADGVLTLAFAPESFASVVEYELAGSLPGEYRALPTKLRNAADPGMVHLGPVGALKVLAPGEPATDPYRATPDELIARGRALAAAGKFAEAAAALEEVFNGYTPEDAVARDAARIMLTAHIQSYDAKKVVRDFEVLKEKGPEVVVPFDEVLVVGRAYRDIGEPERAYLVFRALAEASYLEDAQVGEALRQNGLPLEAITYLLDLWREAPGSASIEADLFGLSQVLTDAAGKATSDPLLRDRLARANLSRPQLLVQAIRLIQATLALNPRSPLADEASLALLGDELALEDFEAVTRLAPRFAGLYPKSPFLDSFQYAEALGRFQLGQYDRAIEIGTKIANATYPDDNGVAQPSPNKWQALYILGQIHDARRQPGAALDYYKQVADRFSDAADAVLALGKRTLELPEVTIVRPPGAAPIGAAVRLNPAAPAAPGNVALTYRNVTEVDLKVYPVDLMRLYLTRRNLDGIAGIDLAGITPLHEATVKLADAPNYARGTKTLELPIAKEGAYLVMVRGGDLYASGIVLVTPLELEVTEEAAAGRVRVVVRDAESGNFVPKAQVKVIGSNNPTFTDGRTDLRGVAVAEGISGQVTAVARLDAGKYAFYRGTGAIGGPPAANAPAEVLRQPGAGGKPGAESLYDNIININAQNQNRAIDRLQNRFLNNPQGIRAQEAK